MGPQEQALYNLRDSAAGQDWRPLVTKENVEAALAALPPLRKPDRTGDENRGVRFYNLSDERLTCTILDAEGRESLGSMPGMSPFDRVQFIWDRGCGVMTSPSTVVRVQGNRAYEDYFVNGDSVQQILVLQPAVEEGEAPMQLESGEDNLAQLTAMGYDERTATDALVHSNGDVQAAIAHLTDSPQPPPQEAAGTAPAVELLIPTKTLADLKPEVPGGFKRVEKQTDEDPLLKPREEDPASSKFAKFYDAGGRVIEAPEQGACPLLLLGAAGSHSAPRVSQRTSPSGSKRARRGGAWGFTPTTS